MPRDSVEIVNQSGFPLQIAIRNLVEKAKGDWEVLFSEHAWVNHDDDQSGFIDLVLRNRAKTLVLVIECKRLVDTSWVFLCPDSAQLARRHCKSWLAIYQNKSQSYFGWADLALDPTTPQSEFCVVDGQDKTSRPMLERTASRLVSATEALAWELNNRVELMAAHTIMHFNVIVTNAQLQICEFRPDDVSFHDGKIPEDSKVTEVPVVRFRKQFSVQPTRNSMHRVSDAKRIPSAKENTVLVVNAELFWDFLQEFEIDLSSLDKYERATMK